jgi:hypothetical protein
MEKRLLPTFSGWKLETNIALYFSEENPHNKEFSDKLTKNGINNNDYEIIFLLLKKIKMDD